jgi:signal transduction histidine kinase
MVKHAVARTILIELAARNTRILLSIKDAGHRFCAQTTTQGNGLKNLPGRAELFKGKVSITSAPGKAPSLNPPLSTDIHKLSIC